MEIKQSDKSVRWKFEIPTQIVDAQVVGDNRSGRRVPHRQDLRARLQGRRAREKQIGGNPISASA